VDPKRDDTLQDTPTDIVDVNPSVKPEEAKTEPGTTVTISPDGEPTFITPTPGSSILPTTTEEAEPESPPSINDEQQVSDTTTDPQATSTELEPTEEVAPPPKQSDSGDTVQEEVEKSEIVQEEPDKTINEEPNQEQPNPMAIPPKPKKSGSPIVVIIVAIVVALALAGASVYAYMKMQKTNEPDTGVPAATEQKVEETPKVTPNDIDAATKDIDDQLNTTDDTKDLPTAESLNDQSLGL
jgi:uncharacterized protein HemX